MTVVSSNYERQENELYETPYWAIGTVMKHLPIVHGIVWEPASGNHRIADMSRICGASRVITSDVVTYSRAHDFLFDFTQPMNSVPLKPDAIITNPPYGKGNRTAEKFCRLSLKRCDGWVAMLLTAKFDFGNTRQDLFRKNPRFYGKIALIDRLLFFDGPEAKKGTEDHAWYLWRPIDHETTGQQPVIIYEGEK